MRTDVQLWQVRPIELGADMPTYAATADMLEKKNNGGWRLLGWTFVRAAVIAPGFLILGVPWKKAVGGSLIASGLISTLVLVRVAAAGRKSTP